MNKKVAICTSLMMIFIIGACLVSASHFSTSLSRASTHEAGNNCYWNHYLERSPDEIHPGCKEYWICCTHPGQDSIVFEEPSHGHISNPLSVPDSTISFLEENRDDPRYLYPLGTSDILTFSLNKSKTGYSVESCTNKDCELVVVPEFYEGLPVTEIKHICFSSCKKLQKTVFPNTLIKIGGMAFAYCESLSEMYITKNIQEIEDSAFQECYALSKFEVSPDNQYFDVVDGVLYSKQHTTLVCYPSGKLDKEYSLLETTISISDYAFFQSRHLERLHLNQAVRIISGNSLMGCNKLEEISINSNNQYFTVDDCLLYDKMQETVVFCPMKVARSNVVLPSTVKTIGSGAFSSNTTIKTLTLPPNVTTIESNAISLTSITSINFPNSILTIGAFACTGLDIVTLTLPNKLSTIETSSFLTCKKLETLNIPRSVTKINDGSFKYCEKLSSVNYDGTISDWQSIDICDDWGSDFATNVVHCNDGDVLL